MKTKSRKTRKTTRRAAPNLGRTGVPQSFLKLMANGKARSITDLASALKCTERRVRGSVDNLRRQGHKIVLVERGTVQLKT